MQFNKTSFDKFRNDCQNALEDIAAKYNLSIKIGHISYSEDTFTVKLECAKTDAGDLGQKEFERYCEGYGFAKEDYGREFSLDGHRFKLTGLSVSSPKYSCRALDLRDGKTYKLTENAVKRAFENEVKE